MIEIRLETHLVSDSYCNTVNLLSSHPKKITYLTTYHSNVGVHIIAMSGFETFTLCKASSETFSASRWDCKSSHRLEFEIVVSSIKIGVETKKLELSWHSSLRVIATCIYTCLAESPLMSEVQVRVSPPQPQVYALANSRGSSAIVSRKTGS